jgi:hypothetical protein
MSEQPLTKSMIQELFSAGVSRLVYFDTAGNVIQSLCTRDPDIVTVKLVHRAGKSALVILFDIFKQEWREYFVSNIVCVESL